MPADPQKKDLLELDDPAAPVDAPEPSGMQASVARPTVIPTTFDPKAYAAETEHREQAATITNEVELEEARLLSIASHAPPPRPRAESLVQVEASEEDLEELDDDAQVALLLARLGPLDRVPVLVGSPNELAAQLGDPKAAYIAGFVDGLLPLETIVEVAGLPQLDTLRVLDRMIAVGLAVFGARKP